MSGPPLFLAVGEKTRMRPQYTPGPVPPSEAALAEMVMFAGDDDGETTAVSQFVLLAITLQTPPTSFVSVTVIPVIELAVPPPLLLMTTT